MATTKDKNTGNGMVLTDRDRRLLSDVTEFEALTRQQLERRGHFQSKTRANAILARLVRFGYLQRRVLPAILGSRHAVYFVGPTLIQLANNDRTVVSAQLGRRRSDLFLEHQLAVNDVRLSFEQPRLEYRLERWLDDYLLRDLTIGIVPDGFAEFTYQDKRYGVFLEFDNGTESLARWGEKVRAYVNFAASGRVRERLRLSHFRTLVVTRSALRLRNLRSTTLRETDQIFWFAEQERLMVEGPLAPIWLRPNHPTQRRSLTEP